MLNVSCATEATLLKPIQLWTHKPIYFCSCLLNINHTFPLSHPLCIGVRVRVCLGDRESYVCDLSIRARVCIHVCARQVFVGVCLRCQSVLVSAVVRNLGPILGPFWSSSHFCDKYHTIKMCVLTLLTYSSNYKCNFPHRNSIRNGRLWNLVKSNIHRKGQEIW